MLLRIVLMVFLVALGGCIVQTMFDEPSSDCRNAQAAVNDDPREPVFLDWLRVACSDGA